jgi:serine/threonine protein kinase
MPAPATADAFVGLVRKSGVVDAERLDAHLSRLHGTAGVPGQPDALAGELVRAGLLTPFQAGRLLRGKWGGFHVGRYRVLELIGAGGMGRVFLCEHRDTHRLVAVKVLPRDQSDDPSAVLRFYREARAAAALDHPHIVRAYEIDQEAKVHFLVMEYIDGVNFEDLVRRHGPLDPGRAAQYIRQAAQGLHHAHEAGVVHRDVKPGNVLLDRRGVVKLLDMGLARLFRDPQDNAPKLFGGGRVLGSVDYLAPEQAATSAEVDARADVYGLGGTLYFLLTGRAPFPEGTVAEKLIWHQVREPRPIRALRPEVPEGLAAVVGRMMAKHPSQRYQTAAEVVAALGPWTRAPVPPPPEQEMPERCPAVRRLLQP